MTVNSIFFLMMVLMSFSGAAPEAVATSLEQFASSFVAHYDVRPEGRYAHEYHPFLLNQTAQSLDNLEDHLAQKKFGLKGRMVIVGYEENAVPTYYTDYTRPRINDEATVKNNVGWSMRLHNRFGFMTGFVFRAINELSDYYFPQQNKVFEHILTHDIHLFNSRAALFQRHAFGQAYPLVMEAERNVVKQFKTGDFRGVFNHLIDFWNVMYKEALKVGNQQLAGTQDILFSISYAQHLLRSPLPVFHYFTGPDITYPIEISSKYDKEVTQHAQYFVRRLASQLVPRDDEKTVYIFCSFVDGVGKSTMLGNIKNYMKFGDNIDAFEHVDNSSSQLAELFQYNEKVYIADLPAQISHFTYKPDGFVYVDGRTELTREKIHEISTYFYNNKEQLVQRYQEMVDEVYRLKSRSELLSDKVCDEHNPEYAFVKNIVLLKKDKDSRWVPFKHEGTYYIFNDTEPSELRVLVPLSKVKSEGLKNIQSEQMLFFKGLRFPLAYHHFIDDLTQKLTDEGIKNVVFVDFMSMYPRSSRENVRINYLLQQLGHLYDDFDCRSSLYRDFVSGGELLYFLMHKRLSSCVANALYDEVLLRHALYELIVEHAGEKTEDYSLQRLTSLIRERLERYTPQEKETVRACVQHKLVREGQQLHDVYGLSKDFINFQQFSFIRANAFSQLLIELFGKIIEHESINNLWSDLPLLAKPLDDMLRSLDDEMVEVEPGKVARVCFKAHVECRDELVLSPFLKTLRASWYATLLNLLYVDQSSHCSLRLFNEYFNVPPLYFSYDGQEHFYLLQKALEPWDGEVTFFMQLPLQLFNLPLSKKARFGKFGSKAYNLDWESTATNTGIFAFDANVTKKNKKNHNQDVSFISLFVQKYQNKNGINFAMPLAKLARKLEKSLVWKITTGNTRKEALENGYIYGLSEKESYKKFFDKNNGKKQGGENKKKIFLLHKKQRPGLKLLARMLATLEMVVKDPDADLVVQFGDRDDFKAALRLFESVTMPRYLGLYSDKPLFKDYDAVEPYPSWEFWDNMTDLE